jgi:hypothetical protein
MRCNGRRAGARRVGACPPFPLRLRSHTHLPQHQQQVQRQVSPAHNSALSAALGQWSLVCRQNVSALSHPRYQQFARKERKMSVGEGGIRPGRRARPAVRTGLRSALLRRAARRPWGEGAPPAARRAACCAPRRATDGPRGVAWRGGVGWGAGTT